MSAAIQRSGLIPQPHGGALMPMQKGETRNPGGRPGELRALEKEIATKLSGKVMPALEKLYEIGMDDGMRQAFSKSGEVIDVPNVEPKTRVAALTSFVTHVRGTPPRSMPQVEQEDAEAGAVLDRVTELLLRNPEARAVLEQKLHLVKL